MTVLGWTPPEWMPEVTWGDVYTTVAPWGVWGGGGGENAPSPAEIADDSYTAVKWTVNVAEDVTDNMNWLGPLVLIGGAYLLFKGRRKII